MNILRYDESYEPVEVYEIFTNIKKFFPDGELIAIPKNFDLLLDCTSADLYYLRDKINRAIEVKEAME